MNNKSLPRLNLDLIIFDWDGTLMDSTDYIVRIIHQVFIEYDLSLPTQEATKNVIGLSFYQAMIQLAPKLTQKDQLHLINAYKRHYAKDIEKITLFNGVVEGLRVLKKQGALLAIATGKSRSGLDLALNITELDHLFCATRTVDECASKPDPEMIYSLLKELAIPPNRTAMIGDTCYDLMMANSANVFSIGVSYGAQQKQNLMAYSPLAIFDNFISLQRWLLKNLSRK
jgi:phosphoglycolate phosphatase